MKKLTTLKKHLKYLPFTGFVIIGIIDAISYFYPTVGRIGVYVWYFNFFMLFIYAVYLLVKIIQQSFKHKSFFTLLVLAIFVVLIGINVNDPRNLSGETTIAVTCGIHQLETAPDMGYNTTCFLGYPTRQYHLQAIPTLLFGRSLITLNIGMAMIFMMSIVYFACGFLWDAKNIFKRQDLIVAFSLGLILHLYFFNHTLLNAFEQSSLPLSLGLLFIGLYKKVTNEFDILTIGLLGVVLQVLIYSYISNLAIIVIAGALLLFLILDNKVSNKQKMIILIIGLSTLISMYLVYTFRQDIRLSSEDSSLWLTISNEIQQIYQHLLFQPTGHFLYITYLGMPFLVAPILYGLTSRLGKKELFISIWIIFTFIIALGGHGFSQNAFERRLHRTLVLIPFILWLLIKVFDTIKVQSHLFFKITLALYLVVGVSFQQFITGNRVESNHLNLIYQLQKTELDSYIDITSGRVNVYLFNSTDYNYISTNDEMQYFIPEVNVQLYDDAKEIDCVFDEVGIYLMPSIHECKSVIVDQYAYQSYVDPTGSELMLIYKN